MLAAPRVSSLLALTCITFTCAQPAVQFMHARTLTGSNAPTCNDGTPYVYYYRNCTANWDRKPGDPDFCDIPQRVWFLVFAANLAAVTSNASEAYRSGLFCYDARSCQSRLQQLTSSAWLPPAIFPGGVLSPYAEANPNLYKAAAALLPYCTSDLWLGGRTTRRGQLRSTEADVSADNAQMAGWSFEGADVLGAVINDLYAPPPPSLGNVTLADATDVVVIGGAGIMSQIQRIVALVRENHARHGSPAPSISAVCDGCLLLTQAASAPDRGPNCTTDSDCPASVALQQAQQFWNATAPEVCSAANSSCWLAPALAAALQNTSVPTLLIGNQYDAAQLGSGGCWPLDDVACLQWANNNFAPAMRAILQVSSAATNHTYAFSAACPTPPTSGVTPAYYHTLVRYVDAYNHTRNESLSVALPTFLDSLRPGGPGRAEYTTFFDTCTSFGCNSNCFE